MSPIYLCIYMCVCIYIYICIQIHTYIFGKKKKKKDSYLQVGDRSVWIQGVLPQQTLLIQELPSPAVEGWLEEPIVENILQAVVESAQYALLGDPHRNIWIQPQTLLWRDRGQLELSIPKVLQSTTTPRNSHTKSEEKDEIGKTQSFPCQLVGGGEERGGKKVENQRRMRFSRSPPNLFCVVQGRLVFYKIL